MAERGDKIVCPVCRNIGTKLILRRLNEAQFLSCPVCSFQFIYPSVAGGENFDDYPWTKEFTDNYEQYVEPVIGSLKNKIADVEAIMGRKPGSFLDIGCGNGLYLHAADTLGISNLGTDVDRVNVEFARSKGLNARTAAIEDLELPDRYEFVHLKAVIHLVPDPQRLVNKARDLLAPRGIIYVDVPNQGSLFTKLRILRDRKSYGQLQLPLRRGAYNFRALSYLCERCGLKIVKRVFPYPGDNAYYPLEISPFYRTVFKLFSKLRISSLIGVYMVKADNKSPAIG